MYWKLQSRQARVQLLAGGRVRPSGWHCCSPAVGCRRFPVLPRLPRMGDGMTDESPSMLASGYVWIALALSLGMWLAVCGCVLWALKFF